MAALEQRHGQLPDPEVGLRQPDPLPRLAPVALVRIDPGTEARVVLVAVPHHVDIRPGEALQILAGERQAAVSGSNGEADIDGAVADVLDVRLHVRLVRQRVPVVPHVRAVSGQAQVPLEVGRHLAGTVGAQSGAGIALQCGKRQARSGRSQVLIVGQAVAGEALRRVVGEHIQPGVRRDLDPGLLPPLHEVLSQQLQVGVGFLAVLRVEVVALLHLPNELRHRVGDHPVMDLVLARLWRGGLDCEPRALLRHPSRLQLRAWQQVEGGRVRVRHRAKRLALGCVRERELGRGSELKPVLVPRDVLPAAFDVHAPVAVWRGNEQVPDVALRLDVHQPDRVVHVLPRQQPIAIGVTEVGDHSVEVVDHLVEPVRVVRDEVAHHVPAQVALLPPTQPAGGLRVRPPDAVTL